MSQKPSLNNQNIVAVIWDFDKTLIRGNMQSPLFQKYGIDEDDFWAEVNQLPAIYKERGIRVSRDTIYLNHLLSYVKNGPLKGLSNQELNTLGAELDFFPGLPDFFSDLKETARSKPEYQKHDIRVEHYIISTGLAEMVRGSKIASVVDGIYGCEFIENPLPPYYTLQNELSMDGAVEISQIGVMVDNTIKTRFIFEINKGSNKNADIDVNAMMAPENRRVPIHNMIYVADGPSDVPVFSVVRKGGGRTYAVYDSGNEAEFAQNDALQNDGRVNSYGPADYTPQSSTAMWLKMHVSKICDRIVSDREAALAALVGKPPRHLPKDRAEVVPNEPKQEILFDSSEPPE